MDTDANALVVAPVGNVAKWGPVAICQSANMVGLSFVLHKQTLALGLGGGWSVERSVGWAHKHTRRRRRPESGHPFSMTLLVLLTHMEREPNRQIERSGR